MLYDPARKHLCYKLKEKVSTDFGLELKGAGLLNTTTGDFDYKASLRKCMRLGTEIKGDANKPLTLGVGVMVTSADVQAPVLNATVKKSIAVLEGNHTVLSAKGYGEYDPEAQKITKKKASVRLTR